MQRLLKHSITHTLILESRFSFHVQKSLVQNAIYTVPDNAKGGPKSIAQSISLLGLQVGRFKAVVTRWTHSKLISSLLLSAYSADEQALVCDITVTFQNYYCKTSWNCIKIALSYNTYAMCETTHVASVWQTAGKRACALAVGRSCCLRSTTSSHLHLICSYV